MRGAVSVAARFGVSPLLIGLTLVGFGTSTPELVTSLFPSPKSVDGHLTNSARLEWSHHAHRRTFATVAVEAGVLEEIVGRLLNHTPLSITGQRYVKPRLEALRPAMETVCRELTHRSRIAVET